MRIPHSRHFGCVCIGQLQILHSLLSASTFADSGAAFRRFRKSKLFNRIPCIFQATLILRIHEPCSEYHDGLTTGATVRYSCLDQGDRAGGKIQQSCHL